MCELTDVRRAHRHRQTDKCYPPTEHPYPGITTHSLVPLDGLAPFCLSAECVRLLCLVERGHLFGPYLCFCLVRYSNASAVCLATPFKKQQGRWQERERKERGGEMLISQQLKAHKQGGARRGKKAPNHAVTHNYRVATDTHFSHHLHQKGAAPVFIQAPFFF